MTGEPRRVGKGPLDMARTASPQADPRLSAPAALRNRDAILAVLRARLDSGTARDVLEIGCGTGEHAAHFAAAEQGWRWTPSDAAPTARASAAAWTAALGNVAEPLAVDLLETDKALKTIKAAGFDAVYCANLIHIAPFAACAGLMAVSAHALRTGGALHLYGPFIRADGETAPSNLDFDASLRAKNPEWGLRGLDDVAALAEAHGLHLTETTPMPANNLFLAFEKRT